jgi:glycogen debranching enzyme
LISKKSIGVSTLSKAHNELYVGSYERDNDSNDFKIAKGFSQYNGPEWVWLYGFYVKAKCNFTKGLKK